MSFKAVSGIVLALLLIGTLTLSFHVQPAEVEATTIVVPDDYPSIQEAINAANPGDTIYVKKGTYLESVLVNKTVALVGEDREDTIIQAYDHPSIDAGKNVVTIVQDDVSVTNFTIENGLYGIHLQGSNNNSIHGNNVVNNWRGIYSDFSSNNIIHENTIWDEFIWGPASYGIYIYHSSDNSMYRNTLNHSSYCIYLSHYSNNNNICNNTIDSGSHGIHLYSSSGNHMYENNMANNPHAIYFSWSSYNEVAENTLANNNFGIYLDRSSNNGIFHNSIINNSQPALVAPSGYANSWDDGYPSGGNYWSNYVDVDLYSGLYQNETDCDGIWDHPYIINADNQDRFPFVNPEYAPLHASFTFSPTKPLKLEEITFNASASYNRNGEIVQYEWDMDDGRKFATNNPVVSHYYNGADDYNVNLTVWGSDGMTTSTCRKVKITEDWNFAIITDIHMGYYFSDYGTVSYNDTISPEDYWLTTRLNGTVSWINTHEEPDNIHFVVVLGDISDSGERSELLRAREFLNKLNIPYIPVIGNHDIWPYTQEERGPAWRDIRRGCIKEMANTSIGDQFFYEIFWEQNIENREKIGKFFGDSFTTHKEEIGSLFMNYAFTYKEIQFIALDLVDREPDDEPESSGAILSLDTQQWLTTKLLEYEPTILLSHHALIMGIAKELTWEDAGTIDNIIKDSNSEILANFAGHNHRNDDIDNVWNLWTHIDVVTTEAVCRESCAWYPRGFVTRTGDNIRIVNIKAEEYDCKTLRSIGDDTQLDLVRPWWAVWAGSPVDLNVTDPDGFIITKEIGEVAGMFYSESDWDNDGELDDTIFLGEVKAGDYLITVIPEPNASLTDTYTLLTLGFDGATVSAENVTISDIPAEPYVANLTTFTLNIPPTTLLDIADPKTVVDNSTYLTFVTPIDLRAKDNSYGSGLASTFYRVYNSTFDIGWNRHTQTIYLTGLSHGHYHLDYYSVDLANNTEPTNTAAIVLHAPWDITGPTQWVPDEKCDTRDLELVAALFGSRVGDDTYDVRADITGSEYLKHDGKIDIRDLAIVAKHFGELDL